MLKQNPSYWTGLTATTGSSPMGTITPDASGNYWLPSTRLDANTAYHLIASGDFSGSSGFGQIALDVAPVPEPSPTALLLVGLTAWLRRRPS